jgi:hypothetical protein
MIISVIQIGGEDMVNKLDERMEKLKPEDIDGLLRNIAMIGQNFEKVREKYDLDSNLGEIMMKADNPDAKLKVNEIIRVISLFDQIKSSIVYLNQPIKMEGVLQWKLDGTVKLNEIAVPENTKLEYLAAEQWNIGYLKRNKETNGFVIVDDRGKIVVSKIEQIPARIR